MGDYDGELFQWQLLLLCIQFLVPIHNVLQIYASCEFKRAGRSLALQAAWYVEQASCVIRWPFCNFPIAMNWCWSFAFTSTAGVGRTRELLFFTFFCTRGGTRNSWMHNMSAFFIYFSTAGHHDAAGGEGRWVPITTQSTVLPASCTLATVDVARARITRNE